MNRKFIAKELRENRWVLLAMLLITATIGFTYPLNYRELFGILIVSQVNYERFIWYDWFGKTQLQILLTGCIILGSTAIARETARGTVGLLCTLPISRWGVLSRKLLTGILSIIVLILFGNIVTTMVAGAIGIDIGTAKSYMVGILAEILLLMPIYLLSVLLSAIFLNSLKAGLTSTVFVFALYAPYWFGSKLSIIMWLMKNPGTLDTVCILLLIIFSITIVYITKKIYSGKDL
jgi:hypothetical protein